MSFQISQYYNLSDSAKYELTCLETQIGVEYPIRPLKGFSLNFSSVLASLGLTLTYTVVLLQFKIQENWSFNNYVT